MPNRPRLETGALALLLTAFVPACSDDAHDAAQTPAQTPAQTTTPDGGAPPDDPVANAYATLVRGDFASLPGVIAALDDAVANDPKNQLVTFYAGVMHLWRMTQGRGDPAYADFGADTQAAFADLDTARKLDPTDPHAAGFYGIALVTGGNLVRNQKAIDDGAAVLEQAVALYPAYIHGIQALAFGALPRENPSFGKAAEAIAGTVAECAPGAPVAPPAFAYRTDLPADRLGTCSDEGVVAHVWEGFWLTYGDIVAKQGNAEDARIAYGNANHAPAYDRWTLRSVLEERLLDLDSRVTLYADADATNDPPTWMEEGHLCVGCHANAR